MTMAAAGHERSASPHARRHRSRSRSRDRPAAPKSDWTPPPTRRQRSHGSGWDIAADGTHIGQAFDPNANPERLAMMGQQPMLFTAPVNALGQPLIAGQASMQGPGGSGPRADRQMRRLYAGNLPHTTEHDLMHFFNVAMRTALVEQAPGDSVISVYLNTEKRFGFIEFRTVEEATAALALDGIVYGTFPLKVRRPSDYNPSGFTTTMGMVPNLDVSRLGIVSTQVPDGPNKLFCGGLPYELNEEQVRELLETYGPIKAFHLVREKETNMSKGYCFFEYAEPSVSEEACAGLNNIQLGDRMLTVRAAYSKDELIGMGLADGMQPSIGPPLNVVPTAPIHVEPPSYAIVLLEMVIESELLDEKECEEIKEDIDEECSKYGAVVSIVIPRPGFDNTGVGKVFVRFESIEAAQAARDALAGRGFANRTVVAQFYSLDKFEQGVFV